MKMANNDNTDDDDSDDFTPNKIINLQHRSYYGAGPSNPQPTTSNSSLQQHQHPTQSRPASNLQRPSYYGAGPLNPQQTQQTSSGHVGVREANTFNRYIPSTSTTSNSSLQQHQHPTQSRPASNLQRPSCYGAGPSYPQPTQQTSSNPVDDQFQLPSTSTSTITTKNKKRPSKCSSCHQYGHNKNNKKCPNHPSKNNNQELTGHQNLFRIFNNDDNSSSSINTVGSSIYEKINDFNITKPSKTLQETMQVVDNWTCSQEQQNEPVNESQVEEMQIDSVDVTDNILRSLSQSTPRKRNNELSMNNAAVESGPKRKRNNDNTSTSNSTSAEQIVSSSSNVKKSLFTIENTSRCQSPTAVNNSSYRSNLSAGESEFLNKDTEDFTVQMGFKRFIGLSPTIPMNDDKLKFYNNIINSIKLISSFVIDVSYFFEFAFNHENKKLVNYIANLDKFSDVKFIFNMLISDLKYTKKRPIDEDLKLLHQEYLSIVNPHRTNKKPTYALNGKTKLYEAIALEYYRNLKTNITHHCWKRIAYYLKRILKCKNWYSLIDDLFRKNIKPPNIQLFNQFNNLNFKKFSSQWWKFLPFLLELQKICKNFVLIPIYKCGLKFVRISTSGLREIVKHHENVEYKVVDKMSKHELWKKYTNINFSSSLGKKFGFSIATDGSFTSILCKREIKKAPNINKEKLPIKKEKIKRIISNDPGVRCSRAGIIVNSIDDIRNIHDFDDDNNDDNDNDYVKKNVKKVTSKEKIYCCKNSTHRYRCGEIRRQKKRMNITGNVDKKVMILTETKYTGINLKDPTEYLKNLNFRSESFDLKQPSYESIKLANLNKEKKIQKMRQIDREINSLVYDVGAKNRKKKISNKDYKQRENERKAIIKKFTKKPIIPVVNIVDNNNDGNNDNIITRASAAITTASTIVNESIARVTDAYKKNDISSAVIAQSIATAATANIISANIAIVDKKNISAIIQEDKTDNNQLNQINDRAIKIKNIIETKAKLKKARKLARQLAVAAKNKNSKSNYKLRREKKSREKEQQKKKDRRLKIKIEKDKHNEAKRNKYLGQSWPRTLRKIKNDDDNKIIIYFVGSSKSPPWIKGYVKPPLSLFEHKIKKHKNVYFIEVDEFRTTILCSRCNEKLIVSKHGHRYTYCPSCNITWNRDVNAGRNILIIGLVKIGLLSKEKLKNYNNFLRETKLKN